MATPPPPVQIPSPSPVKTPPPPNSTQFTTIYEAKPVIPLPAVSDFPPAATPLTPEPAPTAPYTITIPSCSGWFSCDEIHETERRILPEFFDGRSASRNPRVYKYYRDSIIGRFRGNPTRKLTLTEARRGLVGDVVGIRRVFDFLESWGLINYSAKPPQTKKPEVEGGSAAKAQFKKLCSNCKSACGPSYFTTDKVDFILCTRCFVRNTYWPGLSSKDFKRVDISEETKTEWTDKETLHLLEAILHHGENWKKVAEHVSSRSEKECVARFIKLPFGEQFMGPEEGKVDDTQYQGNDKFSPETDEKNNEEQCLPKRRRLTPLSDASNPIMAQVAFLSAMVGSEVAEAASQAAIAALHEVDLADVSCANGHEASAAKDQDDVDTLSGAAAEARLQRQIEQTVSDIVEVQMKDIQEKTVHFEEAELLLEKERLQLRQMRELLFADQLAVLQHRPRSKPSRDGAGEIKTKNNCNDAT